MASWLTAAGLPAVTPTSSWTAFRRQCVDKAQAAPDSVTLVDLPRRARFRARDLLQQLLVCISLEGPASGEKLIENDAQTEDIAGMGRRWTRRRSGAYHLPRAADDHRFPWRNDRAG